MNVSGSCNSHPVSIDTDQKTVHKSDVDRLARSVKNVRQSCSEMVKQLKSQNFSGRQKVDIMTASEGVVQKLSAKLAAVEDLRGELGRSSYGHADFKGERLDSLAKKIESDVNSLQRAKIFAAKENPLLAKWLEKIQ